MPPLGSFALLSVQLPRSCQAGIQQEYDRSAQSWVRFIRLRPHHRHPDSKPRIKAGLGRWLSASSVLLNAPTACFPRASSLLCAASRWCFSLAPALISDRCAAKGPRQHAKVAKAQESSGGEVADNAMLGPEPLPPETSAALRLRGHRQVAVQFGTATAPRQALPKAGSPQNKNQHQQPAISNSEAQQCHMQGPMN